MFTWLHKFCYLIIGLVYDALPVSRVSFLAVKYEPKDPKKDDKTSHKTDSYNKKPFKAKFDKTKPKDKLT